MIGRRGLVEDGSLMEMKLVERKESMSVCGRELRAASST